MTNPEMVINPAKLDETSRVVLQYLGYSQGNMLSKGKYHLPVLDVSVNLTNSLVCRPSSRNFRLHRWEIVGEKIGEGAFSTVYESIGALKPEKHFTYSPPKKPRIIKEINFKNIAGMQVEPRHIIKEMDKTNRGSNFLRCKSSFFAEKKGFLIMNKAPGMELFELITQMRDGRIEVSYYDLLLLTKSILLEVHNLHKKGVIHRDLKSDNIVVDLETKTAKLIDFAFIKPISFPKPRYKSLRGTLGFLPPDDWYSNKVSTATDWFAIGWTLAQLWGDTALNDVFFNVNPTDLERKILAFLSKESFCNLFHHINVPLDSKTELESLLKGLVRCDEGERLRGYSAIARCDKLIKNHEQTMLPVCNMV